MLTARTMIACTTVELAYLAALAGEGPLIGAPDPFHGWIALEIEEALIQARETLSSRGLIQIDADGTVSGSAQVAELLQACKAATTSYRLARTLPEVGSSLHHFYTAGDRTVELATTPGAEQVFLMQVDDLAHRIADLLHLDGQAVPTGAGGRIPETLLRRVQDLSDEGRDQEAAVLLHQAGLSLEAAVRLASDLAEPVLNAALVALHHRGTGWQADGTAFLEGLGGLWLLTPAQDWVTISPAGAGGARTAIGKLIGA
ncbi:MAG: hypothetical protein K0R39_2682 [Symbiobacteriaceae bacterium]|jgi:hypothetical protein|nr:hypothetical protein [Symbiobacteriaceae bacterium]